MIAVGDLVVFHCIRGDSYGTRFVSTSDRDEPKKILMVIEILFANNVTTKCRTTDGNIGLYSDSPLWTVRDGVLRKLAQYSFERF